MRLTGGEWMKPEQKLRKIRISKGVAQVHIAQELGISPSLYNAVEHSRRPFRMEYVKPLARILHVDPAEFLEEE